MSAENKYFKFIFSFKSGEQVIYDDISNTIRITDDYYSPFLVSPDNTNAPACECEHLIHFSTIHDTAYTDFVNFQTFCSSILSRRKQADEINNICIITSDGETFYNISEKDIIGMRFGGNSHDGVLYFNLEIFLNKGE